MFLITEIFFSISNLIHVLADDQLTRVLTKTAKKIFSLFEIKLQQNIPKLKSKN